MLRLERLDEGTRTRVLRVAAGLSQQDLASQAKIDRRRLSEHERGACLLPSDALARVVAVLDHVTQTSGEQHKLGSVSCAACRGG
jgi:transcriptional regulator with XRE-family HTH domain